MDHTVHLPLSLNLVSASQTKAVKSLVHADIAEHRLDHRHPVAVDPLTFLTINPDLHPVGVIRLFRIGLQDERDLPTVSFPAVR